MAKVAVYLVVAADTVCGVSLTVSFSNKRLTSACISDCNNRFSSLYRLGGAHALSHLLLAERANVGGGLSNNLKWFDGGRVGEELGSLRLE